MKLNTSYKLLIILGFGLIIRLVLSNFGTLALDQNTFIAWSNSLVNGGFGVFYNNWSDYLPGYLYVLWILGKINSLKIIDQSILYKLPAIAIDLATAILVFKVVKKIKGDKWALISTSLFLFNPAIMANSALWGQVDSITAFFSILAVYLASTGSIFSAVALGLGTLVKPQAAFVAPVVLFMMIKNKWNFGKIILYGLLGLGVFVLGFVPFNNIGNIFEFIVTRISVTVNQYPYGSVNAFSFWGLSGFWKPDMSKGLTYIVPVAAIVFAYFKTKKEKYSEYILLAISLTTTFMFLARMHERHLLPALIPMVIAGSINPLVLVSYIGMSVTYLLNLNYSYNWISNNFISIYPEALIKIFIFINLVLTGNLFYSLYKKIDISKIKFSFSKPTTGVPFPKLNFKIKNPKVFLIAILVFAFVSRILFLGSPANEYFDEVYHAFTARTMLHGDAKAWEWWNTPPEGFAYEWTHPPFAKEAMVVGMTIFGENSFGWRLPAALFGTGSVFVVYLIAKKLFKDEVLALASAGALSLDGLSLVLSRIGMNDSYFLFFALLSIYLFLKENDLGSTVALGLAASSKWTVFWLIPILGIIFLSLRRKLKPSLILFFVLPPLIYFASYLPMFEFSNHNLNTFIEVQKQMWWYHTNLKATHAYTSMWWSWPFLIRPVWLYTSGVIGGFTSNIYAMGNPIVFWFGLVSATMSGYWAYKIKDKKIGIIVFAYLAFFVSWAISPRIMFLYHYLPAVPFLAIATGYTLRRYPKLLLVYFSVALIVFIYFYPHYTGIKVPVWLDNSYYWFDTWR